MEILATYNSYKNHIGRYKDWKEKQDLELAKRCALKSSGNVACSYDSELAKKKAKIIADSTLILDDYAQTKAEDIEAVFQTLEVELLGAVTAMTFIPESVKNLIPILEKKAKDGNFAQKAVKSLKAYQDKTIKLFNKNIPLPKALKYTLVPIAAALYVPFVTKFVKGQLGATRRAKFDVMHNELSDPRGFAVLTPEQEKQVDDEYKLQKNNKKHANKLKAFFKSASESVHSATDAINIPKMLRTVKDLNKSNLEYEASRTLYDKELKSNELLFDKIQLTDAQKNLACSDKTLLNDIVKVADINTMPEVERIDKIVNVGYGSLFMGGFLEYLMTDKVVEALKVKNPVIKLALNLGVPFTCYMLINKGLATLQNDALKAIRYKHLKEFVNNSENFNYYNQNELDKVPDNTVKSKEEPKKQNLVAFLLSIFKDIKEYKKYKKQQFTADKEKMRLKKNLNLSNEQIQEAKDLQRNTYMTINKVANNNQKFSESLETLTEILVNPLELGCTALGAVLGKSASNIVAKGKYPTLFKALGALIGFIPAAAAEYIMTGKQKKALKVAGMLVVEDHSDYRKFVDYNEEQKNRLRLDESPLPPAFSAFAKKN